ncbi:MAG: MarR family transcriptional regulator [Candidatus Hodarchaeales archaeon]
MSKQAKLMLIKQVKKEKETKKQEYSLEVDGFVKTISSNPRTAYNLHDLLDYFNQIKMISTNFLDKTYRDFATLAVRTLGSTSGDFVELASLEEMMGSEDTSVLKERIRELEAKLAAGVTMDEDTELMIQELRQEVEVWKSKYQQLKTSGGDKIKEYEDQIKQLNNQLTETSDNFRDRVTEYMEELNKAQSETDELRRSNEKLNYQIDEIGKILMTNEEEKNTLTSAIADRDRQLKEAAAQIARLSEIAKQSETLQETVLKASAKIKELTNELELKEEELKAKSSIAVGSPELIEEYDQLKRRNKELEDEVEELTQENTMLLDDINETSKAAKQYKEELEKLKKNYKIVEEEKISLDSKYNELKSRSDELKDKIKEEIVKAENAIADKENINRELLSVQYKYERLEKELESANRIAEELKTREKQLEDELDSSSSEKLKIEGLEREINRLKKHIDTLEGMRVKEKKDHEKSMAKLQESIDKEKEAVKDLHDEITELEEQLEKYRENMQGLRLYLEENPKYAILFLIQDLKTAKITEIHKALGTAPPITSKLVRSLEKEGWVKINEDGPEMEVELIKEFLPE